MIYATYQLATQSCITEDSLFFAFETEEDFRNAQDFVWEDTKQKNNLVEATPALFRDWLKDNPVRLDNPLGRIPAWSFMRRSAWEELHGIVDDTDLN